MWTDWVNDTLFGDWIPSLADSLLTSWQVADWLKSLIIDGIIAGVGTVLGFCRKFSCSLSALVSWKILGT